MCQYAVSMVLLRPKEEVRVGERRGGRGEVMRRVGDEGERSAGGMTLGEMRKENGESMCSYMYFSEGY